MSQLAQYSLERLVGQGGMAEVWQARVVGPDGFEKIVAVKRVLRSLAGDTEFVAMFAAEAKLVAGLVHPNIVQVTGYGVAPGEETGVQEHFIAMEYVDGGDLATLLLRANNRARVIPVAVSVFIARQAARALGCAHARGIVHRDISPHNLLASRHGEIKVTDFGIAKVTRECECTARGVWKGKIPYMSPEQAALKPLDGRSDLFSLGLVLYELLTRRRRHTGSSSEQIYSHLLDFAPLRDEEVAFAPPAVRQILKRALALDPKDRFADALEMEAALSAALGSAGEIAAREELASFVTRLLDDCGAPVPPPANLVARPPTLTHVPPPEIVRTEAIVPSRAAAPIGRTAEYLQTIGRAFAAAVTAVRTFAIDALPSELRDTVRSAPSKGTPPREKTQRRPPRTARLAGPLLCALVSGIGVEAGHWLSTRSDRAETPPAIGVESQTRPATGAAATATSASRRGGSIGTGFLTVHAAPWCEVWIDHRRVARETPLRHLALSAGRHSLVFRNRFRGYSDERSIRIYAATETRLFVDGEARLVRADVQRDGASPR